MAIATPVIVATESTPGVVVLTSQVSIGAGEPGKGVPTGGTAGQALVKINSENYNTKWETISSGGLTEEQKEKIAAIPAAGTTGQSLVKTNNENYKTKWETITGITTAQAEKVAAIPTGGTTGQSLVKTNNENYKTEWKTITGSGGGETKLVKLGEVTGTVEVNLESSPSPRYIELTLKGSTTVKFKNAPTEYAECIFEITQSASSEAFTFAIEGVEWVGTSETPEFNKGKGEKTVWSALVLGAGARVVGSYASRGPKGEKGGKKITSHSWAPSGEAKEETLGGMFVELAPFGGAATEEQKLVGVMYKILEGTNAKFEVFRNAAAIEWEGAVKVLEAKPTAAKKAINAETKLANEDFINVKITTVTGAPKLLSITLFIEHN